MHPGAADSSPPPRSFPKPGTSPASLDVAGISRRVARFFYSANRRDRAACSADA